MRQSSTGGQYALPCCGYLQEARSVLAVVACGFAVCPGCAVCTTRWQAGAPLG